MTEGWNEQALLQPISGPNPCGRSLDDAEVVALDAYRVFAQGVALDAPLAVGEQGRTPKPADSPEWLDIGTHALKTLAASKDLRVLALLSAALLRTDGVPAFCRTTRVASAWLRDYWDTVYPAAGEDVIERRSALSSWEDQFAIVDALRRSPLVTSRQHGRFSLRDIEQAPSAAAIDAAFDEVPLAGLQAFDQHVAEALRALGQIEARMRDADPDAGLSFDRLTAQLQKLHRVLRVQLARRPDSGVVLTLETAAAPEGPPAAAIGEIRSRQDAVRALDAVAAFFRQTEPSSPVPLLLDRAKRLISKSFLEVLADIAPSALGEARLASGVKQE